MTVLSSYSVHNPAKYNEYLVEKKMIDGPGAVRVGVVSMAL